MNLFIFAGFFPYKRSEPFLVNEFKFSQKYFSDISLVSLYGKQEDSLLSENSGVTCLQPVFDSPNSKKKIFRQGFFNLAPFGYHLKELPALLLKPSKLYWWFISVLITRAALSSKAFKALVIKVNASPQTILYFYWGDNLCWTIPYLLRKVNRQNMKIVVRLHGSDLYEDVKADYAPIRKTVFAQADLIVSVSEGGATYLKERYPEFKDKINVSHLGVFDHGLNPQRVEGPFVIVSASNLVPLKRVHRIFESLQKVNAAVIWYHFGDGPLAAALRELVKSARPGLLVHLMGHVSNDTLINFYRTRPVDLFINLSTSEGLPVSIMEALSFGIPVIAPNIGGIKELIDNNVGMLIDVSLKPAEIAIRLEQLLHLQSASEQRKNARKVFEEKVSAETNYNLFYKRLKDLYS